MAFYKQQAPALDIEKHIKILELYPCSNPLVVVGKENGTVIIPSIAAVLFPKDYSKIAKTFWQHSGDGVSSRYAELCHKAFDDGYLAAKDCRDVGVEMPLTSHHESRKGPRRYRKETLSSQPQITTQVHENGGKIAATAEGLGGKEHVQFLEERYGRNLDMSLASKAKLAIRRRIAGALTVNLDLHEAMEVIETPLRREVQRTSDDDVYLWPSGMSSIFNTHRIMIACRGAMQSISYG